MTHGWVWAGVWHGTQHVDLVSCVQYVSMHSFVYCARVLWHLVHGDHFYLFNTYLALICTDILNASHVLTDFIP